MSYRTFAACIALMLSIANHSSAADIEAGTATNHTLRVVLVGDSTVANYAAEKPARGWGMYLQEKFNGTVAVSNLAANGRSTKTFISEGRWAKALALKPDYIFIQFGHNDSHDKTKPEATDAATDFRDFLRQYVEDARKAGAVPIFVTPMLRRTYSKTDGKLQDGLLPYSEAMKSVALEKKAALIDLHSASRELYEKLGQNESDKLAAGPTDQTHFNEAGARAMADLVVKGLPEAAPELAKTLKANKK